MSTSLRNVSAALLAIAALSACDRPQPEPSGNLAADVPEKSVIKLPDAIPTPTPNLDRTALLAALARAASAHAAGQDDRAAQAELNGRRFVLKIRFGCGAPASQNANALAWTYDEADQRLTIRATPDIDAGAAPLEGVPEGSVEAVEGFWIPQPWLLTDVCPAQAAAAGSAASPPTVGIAQYFTAEDSRVHRLAQGSYEIVRRAEPAIMPPSGGVNLILEGRLKAWPQGGVIRCRGAGQDAPPVCILSAEFDRVAFENPQSGLVLAQWRAG